MGAHRSPPRHGPVSHEPPAQTRTPLGVLVIGSLHMDLIGQAERWPGPGSSVLGTGFSMTAGGKAGNQAAQIARLGVPAWLLARVGQDDLGPRLVGSVAEQGVNTSLIGVDRNHPTGASVIFAVGGEYASMIIPSAAAALDETDLTRAEPILGRIGAVLLQLELPMPFVLTAARWAHHHGKRVVLNASPLHAPLPDGRVDLMRSVSLLAVNRAEASALSGQHVGTAADGNDAATRIQERYGVAEVVVTLGALGAVAVHPAGFDYHPAWPVTVVDTVGAGDAFLGTLVATQLEGASWPHALAWATAAGALAAGRSGALASMPDKAAVEAELKLGPSKRRRPAR